jgi:putative (di)nucleoside polyphosphate hydrolase
MAARDPALPGIAALPYRRCVGLVVANPTASSSPASGSTAPARPGRCPRAASTAARRRATPPCANSPRRPASRQRRQARGRDPDWLRYDLPPELVPQLWGGRFRGQEQRWFLVRFLGDDAMIDIAAHDPEFSAWAWLPPAAILERIVPFKRHIYRDVFSAFADRL